MYSTQKKVLITVIGFLLVFGGVAYHVYAFENLTQEIEEISETVEVLEEQKINYSVENKSISEDLKELESEYREAQSELEKVNERLDEKESELEEKDSKIEQLNRDLEAKLEYEANLAQSKLEGELAESTQDDKSEVLSQEDVAKSEQSNEEEAQTSSSNSQNTNIGTFEVTYYSAYDGSQIGITRGGTDMANGNIYTADGYRIIAVDPNTIPFGSIVRVTTSHGETFMAKADDTGGLIQGNKIDIAVSTPEEAFRLGRGTAEIEIIE